MADPTTPGTPTGPLSAEEVAKWRERGVPIGDEQGLLDAYEETLRALADERQARERAEARAARADARDASEWHRRAEAAEAAQAQAEARAAAMRKALRTIYGLAQETCGLTETDAGYIASITAIANPNGGA